MIVPKKTIDEAIQTNERELEYRRQLEEREEQLKRAARRQQTASPLQYSQAESSEGEEYYYYSETDEEGKTKEEGKENVQVETEPHQQQPPQKTSKGFAKYFYTPNKQPQTVNVPKSAPPQRPVFRSMPKRSSPLRQAATKDSGTNINTEVGKEDFISIANHFVQSNFVGCLDL